MTEIPRYIIIPTKDIITEYNDAISGIIDKCDLNEIYTQTIHSLMNSTLPGEEQEEGIFLNFKLFRNKTFIKNENMVTHVKVKSYDLLTKIDQRLNDYGLFENGDFPFFFHSILSNDLVLEKLPY